MLKQVTHIAVTSVFKALIRKHAQKCEAAGVPCFIQKKTAVIEFET
jgi:hypothetical protein